MPPGSADNLHLEIGHILFIDIVGYSKLLIEEQKERLNELTEIVLGAAQVRETPDEQLVRLPTGDGMALVFRRSRGTGPVRARYCRSAPEAPRTSLRARLMNAITSKWWDWRILPRGLQFFCEAYYVDYDRPILIAENGMASRHRQGESKSPRRDGMTRSQFLRLHVHEVNRMRKRGIPVIGYLYWSLFETTNGARTRRGLDCFRSITIKAPLE